MFSKTKESFLRTTLLANAVFTTGCGLALVLASGTLAAMIGAVGGTTLLITGVILLFYAADLARTAFGKGLPRGRIYYFIVMDLLWVVGSAVVLWGFDLPFTPTGQWIILLIADAVGLFGILQYIGLRRLSKPNVEAATSATVR